MPRLACVSFAIAMAVGSEHGWLPLPGSVHVRCTASMRPPESIVRAPAPCVSFTKTES